MGKYDAVPSNCSGPSMLGQECGVWAKTKGCDARYFCHTATCGQVQREPLNIPIFDDIAEDRIGTSEIGL